MPTIKTNGINMYYEERGSGEPLLLIMGITAPGSTWNVHLADWKHHFRCIIGDNRGVGQTDKPAGPYSSEQMADDYAGLLDFLGIEKVSVVVSGEITGFTLAGRLKPPNVQSGSLFSVWANAAPVKTNA